MKKHHAPDYAKNTTADVIPAGWSDVNSPQQWQINRDLTPSGNDTPYGAFNPRTGKSRSTVYTKTNECDH